MNSRRSSFVAGGVRTGLAVAAVLATMVAMAADATEPEVSLDQLLRLPDSYDAGRAEQRGGAGEAQWRQRFHESREKVTAARAALERTQARLQSKAGDSSQWQAAAPGIGSDPNASPLSYKLREELREQRQALERVERELLDIQVEANLAAVPEAWRTDGADRPRESAVE